MPDESRIPEIGLFGFTRRWRLKDLCFTLLPHVPFRILVRFGEMQSPTTWNFRENGQVEIIENDGSVEHGGYVLLPNNTIRMSSKRYDFYGLVLYDDYATAVYENGWIAWVKKYQLIPPTFNTLSGKYELN